MLEKYYAWHKAHREGIDVGSVVIVLATIAYLIVSGINLLFTSFLAFTGLKFVLWGAIGFAVANTAWALYQGSEVWEKMEEKDKDEPDEHSIL